MKKTIIVLLLFIILLLTNFANANFLNIKRNKTNLAPETPKIFTDSLKLKVGYSYNFKVITNDIDGDKVQYQFDWDSIGFNKNSEWTELYPSGNFIVFSYSWEKPGQYIIKAQARDEHGKTSDWSDGLTVTVNYENQRRNIMLTGFWQPTSQMIARFSTDTFVNPEGWQGENWENLGYDIYAFVAKEYYDNHGTWEWKYKQIWEEFWNITNQVHPIAIIGFGQGAKENTWNIENKAVNWVRWYPDEEGLQPEPNPPDDTVKPGYIRFTSLPIYEIEKAVNKNTSIKAEINHLGNPGFYFCGYLSYLQLWYKSQHSDPNDEFYCKAAGWIHVNKSIALNECIKATNMTIIKTVEKIKKNVNVNEIIKTDLSSNKNNNQQITYNKKLNLGFLQIKKIFFYHDL
ncbi:MAG: hypothetical protein QHH15_04345 [Candidatus Thermoplasmatota archaeon]|jgi:pyrrolidone-carboxylate peptidase|nr:hypothetical protein [Candidatus Thermoplasmatota archaeon]